MYVKRIPFHPRAMWAKIIVDMVTMFQRFPAWTTRGKLSGLLLYLCKLRFHDMGIYYAIGFP